METMIPSPSLILLASEGWGRCVHHPAVCPMLRGYAFKGSEAIDSILPNVVRDTALGKDDLSALV